MGAADVTQKFLALESRAKYSRKKEKALSQNDNSWRTYWNNVNNLVSKCLRLATTSPRFYGTAKGFYCQNIDITTSYTLLQMKWIAILIDDTLKKDEIMYCPSYSADLKSSPAPVFVEIWFHSLEFSGKCPKIQDKSDLPSLLF